MSGGEGAAFRYRYRPKSMKIQTTSRPTPTTYARYIHVGKSLPFRRNRNAQSPNITSPETPTPRTVDLPVRPLGTRHRLGCRDWKTSSSSRASTLTIRSISSIRRRWSSFARACCTVVRTSHSNASGNANRIASRVSLGRAATLAIVTAKTPAETGSRRSMAVRRKIKRAFSDRYSSRRISIRSLSVMDVSAFEEEVPAITSTSIAQF